MYDISEQLISGSAEDSPLASLSSQDRVQINVRPISLPWLGTHVHTRSPTRQWCAWMN